ncbi:MAG: tetratricopeptide repeat protein [Planctomycetes bacterium]|nr:tetratricopeptide repeat protein [Planctomycetota bacterium]
MSTESTQGATATVEVNAFDIKTSPVPSFGALSLARGEVFRDPHALSSFRSRVTQLADEGEEGRRKGLGLWMLADYAAAAQTLARYESDHVAAFTRAKALMASGHPAEAAPVFERLSKTFPEEARPRGGLLEARLEAALASGDADAALAGLERGLADAPASFATSAEGLYLRGRAEELRGEAEAAIQSYDEALLGDPTHRSALFRMGYLCERAGEEDRALDAYQQLGAMLPIDRNVLINLGILYEDLGRDQEAAACYDVAVRHFPTDRRLRRFLDDARSGMNMYYDEDMERKEDRLNQILRIPITDFELSVRARNCLNKMNILTLGDLVHHTEQDLLSYKNFGETSLAEIKEILTSKGLRLGMGREEAVASIEAARRRHGVADPNDVMNKAVTELELSIRCRRVVEAIGCITVGDITQHTEEEFLGMPNFGSTSLQELKTKLSEYDLRLKPKTV